MVGVEIVLVTKDLDRAIKFYKEALGFKIQAREKDSATLVFEDNSITFEEEKLLKDAFPELREELEKNQLGVGVTIFLHVDDVDRRCRDIEAKGGKIISEITTQPWGTREFVIKDPDGYLLSIHGHEHGHEH